MTPQRTTVCFQYSILDAYGKEVWDRPLTQMPFGDFLIVASRLMFRFFSLLNEVFEDVLL